MLAAIHLPLAFLDVLSCPAIGSLHHCAGINQLLELLVSYCYPRQARCFGVMNSYQQILLFKLNHH